MFYADLCVTLFKYWAISSIRIHQKLKTATTSKTINMLTFVIYQHLTSAPKNVKRESVHNNVHSRPQISSKTVKTTCCLGFYMYFNLQLYNPIYQPRVDKGWQPYTVPY